MFTNVCLQTRGVQKLKDIITLQKREFDSTKVTLRRYGMGKPMLRRLVKAGVVSKPIRVGNKHYFDRGLLERELIATAGK